MIHARDLLDDLYQCLPNDLCQCLRDTMVSIQVLCLGEIGERGGGGTCGVLPLLSPLYGNMISSLCAFRVYHQH